MGIERLGFDEAVDIVPTGNGSIRFVMPGGEFTLRDPTGLVQQVSIALRSGTPVETMLSSVAAPDHREAVGQLIDLFKARRVLKTAPDPALADPLAGWIRHYGGVADRTDASIEVKGDGVFAEAIRGRLEASGLRPQARNATCVIAVSDDADFPWLRHHNAEACASGRAFLPAWLERSRVCWGPMLVPGATGCLECLLHRRQAARKRAETIVDTRQALSVSPIVATTGSGLVSTEILRWAMDAHVDTDLGMAWGFDLVSMDLSGSRVLRLPRCPACGEKGRARP